MAPIVRAPRGLTVALLLGVLAGCSQAPPQVKAPAEQPPAAAPSAPAPSAKPVSQTPGNCYIEKQKRTPKNLALLGWAVGGPAETPVAISVEVQSGGKSQLFGTKVLDRPDIAKAYKNPALLRTGFLAEIPAADAPAGAKATLVIEGATETYRCKNSFDLQ